MPFSNITVIDIVELFYVDESGRLRNKEGLPRREAHKIVDNRISYKGYRRVRIRKHGVDYTIGAHRAVFAIVNGYLPEQIDHIDGNRQNNLPENLRACSNQQNQWNIAPSRKGISKGVSFFKNQQKWHVRISTKYGRKSFGYHKDLEFANLVAEEAIEKYHGEFARTKYGW